MKLLNMILTIIGIVLFTRVSFTRKSSTYRLSSAVMTYWYTRGDFMKQLFLTVIFTLLMTSSVYAYNPAYIDETGTIYEFNKTSVTGADNSFTLYYLVQPKYDHAAFRICFDYFGQVEADGKEMDLEFVYDFLLDPDLLEEETSFGSIYRIQIPIENGEYDFSPMGRTYTLSLDASQSFMDDDYKEYEKKLRLKIQNNTQSFNIFAIYADDYEWVKEVVPDFLIWAKEKYDALNPPDVYYPLENTPTFYSQAEDLFKTPETRTEIVDVEVTIEEETDADLQDEGIQITPAKIFTYVALSISVLLLCLIVFLIYIKMKDQNE